MRTFILLTALGLCLPTIAYTQCVENPIGSDNYQSVSGGPCANAIPTAIPFLLVNPEARGGAMGNAGLATDVDAFAAHFNTSKLAFAQQGLSIGASYTPWLRNLGVPDIYLAYLSGYYKLNDREVVSTSLKYFSLGDIQFVSAANIPQGFGSPREYAVTLGYARKLGRRISAGVNGKFIKSKLATGQIVNGFEIGDGVAGAVDLSFYYRSAEEGNRLSMGLALSNIGTKISYTRNRNDYLPAIFKLGVGYLFEFDEFNTLFFTGEAHKLMVPTPQHEWDDNDPANGIPDYREMSVPSSIFSSWNDAPEGFSEEINELSYSIGAEYWYNQQFALRTGYFREHPLKGNLQFLTVGLGLKYQIIGVDLSYLVATGTNPANPLDGTLRLSLTFDFSADP